LRVRGVGSVEGKQGVSVPKRPRLQLERGDGFRSSDQNDVCRTVTRLEERGSGRYPRSNARETWRHVPAVE